MRVVLDTNVIVSRFLSPTGAPARVFQAWEQEAFALLVSSSILAEYRRALSYDKVRARHRLADEQLDEVIDGFRRQAVLIEPLQRLQVVVADPADDQFVECAVAGGADYIISGDAHLLGLREYAGIQILAPAAFLTVVEGPGL